MRNTKTVYSKGSILITGAAKRIGRTIAKYLATLNYSIAIHYHHSYKEAQGLAKEIRDNNGHCEIFNADLANTKAVQQLLPKVTKKFPNLQFLINNASLFKQSDIKTGNLTDFDQHFAINLRAPFILTSQFAKLCVKGSSIINILDTNVSKAKTAHLSYLLTKKSLMDLTRLTAVELAPHIRVNAIAPGLILAPAQKTNDYLNRLAKNIPLERRGEPADIAKAVHFLMENTYITGQTIFVDGGEHLS
jgi:pteridine reductase